MGLDPTIVHTCSEDLPWGIEPHCTSPSDIPTPSVVDQMAARPEFVEDTVVDPFLNSADPAERIAPARACHGPDWTCSVGISDEREKERICRDQQSGPSEPVSQPRT